MSLSSAKILKSELIELDQTINGVTTTTTRLADGTYKWTETWKEDDGEIQIKVWIENESPRAKNK
jgi:hypothetical protein